LAASIAHEIRNPLGAISHAGQLLAEDQQLSEQNQRFSKIIESNCTRVNQIIEDILLLSRRSDSRREKIQLQHWLANYLAEYLEAHRLSAGSFKLLQADGAFYTYIDTGHLNRFWTI